MKILLLASMIMSTNVARRARMLERAGFEVEAVGFERHQGFGQMPDCPVARLGRLPPRRYFSRVPRLLLRTGRVREAIRRSDLVYAFGLDMGFLGMVAGAGRERPMALEIADVHRKQVERGPVGWMVRTLEKRVLDRCRLMVLTTEGYRAYYREWLGSGVPIAIVENKLDPGFIESLSANRRPPPPAVPGEEERSAGAPLRIGWFGRLRDEWTLEVLDGLTRRWPERFTAVLAGTPSPFLKDFAHRVAGNPGLEYRGGYEYPRDLPALYGSVDMAMVCYPPEVPFKWSQANRYYEACLFGKPLIVRAGSADAAGVGEHDIGMIIEAVAAAEAAAALGRVSSSDLARWRSNLAALPPSVYTSLGEAEDLSAALLRDDRDGARA